MSVVATQKGPYLRACAYGGTQGGGALANKHMWGMPHASHACSGGWCYVRYVRQLHAPALAAPCHPLSKGTTAAKPRHALPCMHAPLCMMDMVMFVVAGQRLQVGPLHRLLHKVRPEDADQRVAHAPQDVLRRKAFGRLSTLRKHTQRVLLAWPGILVLLSSGATAARVHAHCVPAARTRHARGAPPLCPRQSTRGTAARCRRDTLCSPLLPPPSCRQPLRSQGQLQEAGRRTAGCLRDHRSGRPSALRHACMSESRQTRGFKGHALGFCTVLGRIAT